MAGLVPAQPPLTLNLIQQALPQHLMGMGPILTKDSKLIREMRHLLTLHLNSHTILDKRSRTQAFKHTLVLPTMDIRHSADSSHISHRHSINSTPATNITLLNHLHTLHLPKFSNNHSNNHGPLHHQASTRSNPLQQLLVLTVLLQARPHAQHHLAGFLIGQRGINNGTTLKLQAEAHGKRQLNSHHWLLCRLFQAA
jgi:hypothetical protein